MPVQDLMTPDIQGTGSPYKKLEMVIIQAGVAAPTLVKEHRNSLRFNRETGVALARSGAGVYTLTQTGAFQGDVFIRSCNIQGGATAVIATAEKTSANVLTVRTFDAAGAAADLVGSLHLAIDVWS